MPTNPPNTENIFGVKSGVNLIDLVDLNKNPLDIPKPLYSSLGSWNTFQNYLKKIKFVRDPSFNKNQKETDKIIEEYNNSITNPKLQKITQDSIIAAQTFHKIKDPKIQIDGWVGSQTSQLRYPDALIMYEGDPGPNKEFIPKYQTGWVPIIWGNKRFVVSAENLTKYIKQGAFPPNDLWFLYDENIHKDTLQTQRLQKNWYTLDQNTEITKNATQLEEKRKLEEVKSNISKNITNLKASINKT